MKGNQEDIEPKQHLYYPNSQIKATLIHILDSGECPCNWEKDSMNYTDGNKVYRRAWHTGTE